MVDGRSPYRWSAPAAGGAVRDNVVYRAGSLYEAALLVNVLGEAGVAARVLNEHLAGAIGELPHGQVLPEVWIVDARERAIAERIVSEFRVRQRSSVDHDVRCGACGEDNPGNFEICWSCGADLDLPEGPG